MYMAWWKPPKFIVLFAKVMELLNVKRHVLVIVNFWNRMVSEVQEFIITFYFCASKSYND